MPKATFLNLPEDKRNHILDVAIEEFCNKPYQSASISAIVRDAGIAKSSFYQYFADKRDLYLHILQLGMQQKMALVNQIKPVEKAMDTFDYLRWTIQLSVLFELRYPKLARIAYRAFIEDIPFPDEVDGLVKKGSTFYLNDFLTQGILHNTVAPWVDTDMAAFLLGNLHFQFGRYLLQRMNLNPDDFSEGQLDLFKDQVAQDLFDNLMDLVEAGMGRNPEIRNQFFSK